MGRREQVEQGEAKAAAQAVQEAGEYKKCGPRGLVRVGPEQQRSSRGGAPSVVRDAPEPPPEPNSAFRKCGLRGLVRVEPEVQRDGTEDKECGEEGDPRGGAVGAGRSAAAPPPAPRAVKKPSSDEAALGDGRVKDHGRWRSVSGVEQYDRQDRRKFAQVSGALHRGIGAALMPRKTRKAKKG